MNVNGKAYKTIWINKDDEKLVQIIDQRPLPFEFVIEDIRTVDEMARAIREMHLRGAGLIGVAAAMGMYLAALNADPDNFDADIKRFAEQLNATRPTAANLKWGIDRQLSAISAGNSITEKIAIAKNTAENTAEEDEVSARKIGEYGVKLIEEIASEKDGPVNILTHCNAGWLAFADFGSATAPIYTAFEKGIDVHVWVDETRPRNQGARLTAWELKQHGVPHTIIADNTGGHLMQHNMVDIIFVGADRVSYTGDVANKIGTYLKALAAKDNGVPFYVTFPSSTFDWEIEDGVADIPIEQRDAAEVTCIRGRDVEDGSLRVVNITPEGSPAANYAFDVTPRKLITGLISERGICAADKYEVLKLYPEKK
ncbi:MAG: S-methyl-5-thioribose-1-phosphate isomerase [Spirochaetales bacterium]|uniref:Methylthioribose-1-phosphate isomerase n=1 Tax=Candidatus Thalassospirochaeta sargassi TaxID=3119039 RepID=A0AAJ1MNS8_9SPIO|nr:S-methyl-5-thioribose-1-phosphate isomerase [Spirochaetales bacterium]